MHGTTNIKTILISAIYCYDHNEEFNDLYSSPNIVRVTNGEEWGGRGM